MPWLVGTALLHSLAVTEKRGTFKSWTVLLAIMAFSLSLLGTFLVRSGVLTSVHAFATDPARGVFILAFLAIVIGGSLTLYAMRAGAVGGGAGFAMVSRESALLANNILLVVALGAVFLGTMYPMFLDALNLPKASVGPPYFNLVFPILMAPAAFLMGIGPHCQLAPGGIARPREATQVGVRRCRRHRRAAAVHDGRVVAAGGAAACSCRCGSSRRRSCPSCNACARRRRTALWERLAANPAAWYGMMLAHLGVAVFIVGVTLVKGYEFEVNVPLDVGQSVTVRGEEYTFRGVEPVTGPNYRGVVGTFEVRRDGKLVQTMRPEKRVYNAVRLDDDRGRDRSRVPGRSLRLAR